MNNNKNKLNNKIILIFHLNQNPQLIIIFYHRIKILVSFGIS